MGRPCGTRYFGSFKNPKCAVVRLGDFDTLNFQKDNVCGMPSHSMLHLCFACISVLLIEKTISEAHRVTSHGLRLGWGGLKNEGGMRLNFHRLEPLLQGSQRYRALPTHIRKGQPLKAIFLLPFSFHEISSCESTSGPFSNREP